MNAIHICLGLVSAISVQDNVLGRAGRMESGSPLVRQETIWLASIMAPIPVTPIPVGNSLPGPYSPLHVRRQLAATAITFLVALCTLQREVYYLQRAILPGLLSTRWELLTSTRVVARHDRPPAPWHRCCSAMSLPIPTSIFGSTIVTVLIMVREMFRWLSSPQVPLAPPSPWPNKNLTKKASRGSSSHAVYQ